MKKPTLHKAILLLLLLAARPAGAQAQRPAPAQNTAPVATKRLSFEDIIRWKLASHPHISPDGRRIAFLLSANDLEQSRALVHLWWVDTETRQARRLTHLDEVVADPQWSPDGRWLGFISGRTVDGHAEPHVWLLPVDGGEAFPLTRGAAGVLSWRWAPDSKSIYFVAQEAEAEAAAKLREKQQNRKIDTVVVEDGKLRNEIWRAMVETQQSERIFAGDLGLADLAPSPDGKWLAYRTNHTGDPDHDWRYDIWLLDVAAQQTKSLVERGGSKRSVAWSPDSSRIAFLAPREEKLRYSQEEIFLQPVAWQGSRPEPLQLSKSFTGSIEEIHWTRDGGIWFAAAIGAGNRIFRLDPAGGAVRPASPEALFLGEPDWNADASAAAAIIEGPASLPEIAFWRGTLAEPQKLTDLNPQLKEFALGAQEVLRWKSKDGKEIEGVLLRPVGWDPAKKYPLLLDIHGGPYGRRANTLTTGNGPQAWAARGWMVLQPNFRGSSGYGHEFGLANRGDIGVGDYEDILAGVDFAIAQAGADPERLAIMGESYGGYMTNWIIGHTQRFRAAVSAFGLFSLLTDFSNSSFPSWETDYLAKFYWEDLQLYIDRSPQKFVQQMQTPVLILHGEADDNTFIANSQEMHQALRLLGRKVKFVRFPREGHGFVEPQHTLARFRETAAWLETHVPGFSGEARAAVEGVRRGPWELRVAESRVVEDYAGLQPKGIFLEVTLLLRAAEPTEGRFGILIFDNAGGDVSLATSDRKFYPEGIVSEALGQKSLAKSSSQIIAVYPQKTGGATALAFTVAFDVPPGTREARIQLKDFPPVPVRIP